METSINFFANIAVGIITTILAIKVTAMQAKHDKEKKEADAKSHAIMVGLQSLLRDKLIQGYNKYYKDEGWIPIYVKESLMACAEAYHNLGANGVMDDIIRDLRSLPTCPPNEQGDDGKC